MLAQVIAGGLSAGSIYALVGLALVITYKTTEVPNFAQGEMAMVSAFVTAATHKESTGTAAKQQHRAGEVQALFICGLGGVRHWV